MIEMKGKCAFLDDSFYYKKGGDYSRLIWENKIARIACREAASSNKTNSADAKSSAAD